jgi:hypothetical protein
LGLPKPSFFKGVKRLNASIKSFNINQFYNNKIHFDHNPGCFEFVIITFRREPNFTRTLCTPNSVIDVSHQSLAVYQLTAYAHTFCMHIEFEWFERRHLNRYMLNYWRRQSKGFKSLPLLIYIYIYIRCICVHICMRILREVKIILFSNVWKKAKKSFKNFIFSSRLA